MTFYFSPDLPASQDIWPLLFQLKSRAEGILLEGASEDAHELKVLYNVLKYFNIPAGLIIDGEVVDDPEDINERKWVPSY